MSKGILIGITSGAILEAYTMQIDNITVPLFTYAVMVMFG